MKHLHPHGNKALYFISMTKKKDKIDNGRLVTKINFFKTLRIWITSYNYKI